MKKTGNLPTIETVDLSQAFVVTNPLATPLTSLLFGRGKNFSYTKGRDYSKKIKTLSTKASGKKVEGAEAPDFEKSSFSYVRNNMEIFSKATAISRTAAGIIGKDVALKQEVEDRLLEIKGDIENAMINGVKVDDEDGNTAREMDGLLNIVHEDNIIDAGVAELSEDLIVDAVEKLFNASANNGELFLFCNGTIRRKISKIFKDAQNSTINLVPGDSKVGLSVSQILTDFGTLNVVTSVYIPVKTILIFNIDLVEVPEFQKPFFEELPKTGDYEKGQVVAESTIITYPKGIAKIVNIK